MKTFLVAVLALLSATFPNTATDSLKKPVEDSPRAVVAPVELGEAPSVDPLPETAESVADKGFYAELCYEYALAQSLKEYYYWKWFHAGYMCYNGHESYCEERDKLQPIYLAYKMLVADLAEEIEALECDCGENP